MNRKLTIGITVDSQVRKMLAKSVYQWHDLPVRFHATDSYHVPIITLGWIHEDAMIAVVNAMRDVSDRHASTSIDFQRIEPTWKKKSSLLDGDCAHARSLRCVGSSNDTLRDMYIDLMEALHIPHAQPKVFVPRIVLGQMRKLQWEKLTTYPDMTTEFLCSMDVMQITLFEHTIEDGARVFLPLESFDLM